MQASPQKNAEKCRIYVADNVRRRGKVRLSKNFASGYPLFPTTIATTGD
jgi:hypothetical protein